MIHQHHSLIVYSHNKKIHFGNDEEMSSQQLNKAETLFKQIKNGLNLMFDEGKRAIEDGDFKERQVVKNIHSCDICEQCTNQLRFVCLCCR